MKKNLANFPYEGLRGLNLGNLYPSENNPLVTATVTAFADGHCPQIRLIQGDPVPETWLVMEYEAVAETLVVAVGQEPTVELLWWWEDHQN